MQASSIGVQTSIQSNALRAAISLETAVGFINEKRFDLLQENFLNISDKSRVFQYLCEKGSYEGVKIFLDNRFDVNTRLCNGSTGLHFACRNRNAASVVALLLGAGALDTVTNDVGQTPLALASTVTENESIIELLKESCPVILNGIHVKRFMDILRRCLNAAEETRNLSANGKMNPNLIVGKTGDGKSTFCSWFLGCEYEAVNQGFVLKLQPKPGFVELAPSSAKAASHTTTLQVYQNVNITRQAMLDGPGYIDNRGPEYEMSINVAFCDLFKSCTINSIVVVIDATHFKDLRYTILREIAACLKEVIGNYTSEEQTSNQTSSNQKTSLFTKVRSQYDKLFVEKKSIFFVITHKEALSGSNVTDIKTFLAVITSIMNEIIATEKKKLEDSRNKHDDSPNQGDLLGLLSLMKEDSVFLADHTDPNLRNKINEKLNSATPFKSGQLGHQLTGNNLFKIENFVNAYFQKVQDDLKEKQRVRQAKSYIQEYLEYSTAELERGQKRYQELSKFQFKEKPYTEEDPVLNEDSLRDLIKRVIGPRFEKIRMLRERIAEVEKKDYETNNGTRVKSLRTIESELEEIRSKLKALDTDDLDVFWEETIIDKRFIFFGWLFGFTRRNVEYLDSNKPFVKVQVECKTGSFTEINSNPDKGIYKGLYESGRGVDANARIIILGKKKVKYQDKIKCLQDEFGYITKQQKLTKEQLKNLRGELHEEQTRMAALEKELKDIEEQIVERRISDKGEFERQQDTLREKFNKCKASILEQEVRSLEEAARHIKELQGILENLLTQQRSIDATIKDFKVVHDSSNIELLLKACKIADIATPILQEYQRFKKLAQYEDSELAAAQESFLCSITNEVMHEPMTAFDSCKHSFEKSAILEWTKDHNTCPYCTVPLKGLRDNPLLQRDIRNWLDSLARSAASSSFASSAAAASSNGSGSFKRE